MTDPSMLPLALQSFTAAVARREGGYFRSAILFGSHARGDAGKDSDVDVAVVLGGRPGDALDAVMELSEIAYDVLLNTGVLIQPVPLRQDEWDHPERHSNPRLLDNIRREGRVL